MIGLDLPLVEYFDDMAKTADGQVHEFGRRVGYLLRVEGDLNQVVIQPIGAIGSVPEKINRKIDQVRMVNKRGDAVPEPVSLPADAGDVETKLEKERIKTMATKKSKGTATKEAKPASVKYLQLTDKAPETKDLKEGSHAYAVIAGLRRLSSGGVQGKATRERLLETIAENKLIKTDMDVSKAISWMIGQLKGKGAIKVVREAVA